MLNGLNNRRGSASLGFVARSLRIGVSATGLMLAGTALAPASAQVLDLAGVDQTRATLPFSTILNTVGSADLTVNPVANLSYGGRLRDDTGVLGLVKDGPNALTLTGADNSYSGGTTLLGGSLFYTRGNAFGTGAITVDGAGSIGSSAPSLSLANDFVVNAALTLTGRPVTLSGNFTGAGPLILNGGNSAYAFVGDNSGFSGDITAIRSAFAVGAADALGTGTVTIAGPSPTRLAVASGVGSAVLGNDFVLNGQLHVEATGPGNALTLNGDISGANGILLKNTGGTLILNGNNSFGASVLITGGTIGVGSNTALGAAGVVNTSAATIAAYADGLVIGNSIRSGAPLTFDTRGFDMTFAGQVRPLSGTTPISVTKAGLGELTMTGANVYTGTTTVAEGQLTLVGSLNSNVGVASGATLGGTGTVSAARTVTVADGGILSPGVGGAGTLTLGNLTLGASSFLNFDLGTAGVVGGLDNDHIIVSNNLNLGGTLNILDGATFGVGTYRLFTYGGTLGGGTLAFGMTPGGFMYSLDTSTAGQVNLLVSVITPGVLYWDGSGTPDDGVVAGGSGTWNGPNTNWTDVGGATNFAWPNAVTTVGVFNTVGGDVTVDGARRFGSLTFEVAGYTLSGGSLVIDASTIDTQGDTVIDSVITGVNGLTKAGVASLALGGANTYTGGTLLQAGEIVVGTDTALGPDLLTMSGDTTLTAGVSGLVLANGIVTLGNGMIDSGAGVLTLNGGISGAGSISQIGTGNLVLNGANSFINLGINQGTVTVGNNSAAGLGSIAINDNATLAAGQSGLVLTNGIETTANGLVDSGAGVFTLAGNIGGAGSISQIGTGTLVLDGDNSFINLGINQGTVQVGSDRAAGIGFIAINNNATLQSGAAAVTLANDVETTANGLVNVRAGEVLTLNGVVGGAGSISQVGAGTLVLNGANGFTNLGINQGTVQVGSDTAAGIGLIAINNDATLQSGAAAVTLGNDVETTANGLVNVRAGEVLTLNGVVSGAGSISQVGPGTLVLNGDNSFTNLGINQGIVVVGTNTAAGVGFIAINNDATLAAGVSGLVLTNGIETTANGIVDSGAGIFTLNGTIGGAGSISKIGSGTLVLNGANGFTNLGINQGTVVVGTDTAAGIGLIAINNDTTLAAGVSGLVLANDIETTGNGMVDSGAGVFTLNGDISGAGSISQIGTGTLVLNGANSFINLGINQGTVQVGSDTASGAGFIAINDNATLQSGAAAVALGNDVETTGNGLVNVRAGEVLTLNGNVGGAGSISQIGAGTLVLNGDNSFTNLGINQGTVQVGSDTAAGIGFIAINNDATLQSGAAAVTLANDVETTANGLVNVRDGEVLTLNGTVGGAGSISQVGTGTLVLNGANSFTNLGINQGTVQVGSDTAAGIGFIAINNNATLQSGAPAVTLANDVETTANGLVNVRAGEVLTLNGVVSGAGSISQVGIGNLVLNGANSFINLGINQGIVTVGSNTAAGLGSIAINDGATLAAGVSGLVLTNDIETTGGGIVDSGPGEFTLNGTIGGAGSISQVGTGNLVLNGNNSFTNLGINQGTVTVGTNTAAGIGTIAINNNATLAAGVSGLVLANGIETTGNGIVDSGPGVFTLNGNISGAGSISQVGTGNLVLNGDNSFNNLGINQGTVTVGTDTAAGIGFIAINNDATLAAGVSGLVLANDIETTGNGIVDSGDGVFTLNGDIGGAGSISQVGTGTLVLNGDNFFNNLGINQGTVQVGSDTAAGIGFIAINNNATLQSGGAAITLANDVETTGNGLVNVRDGEVLTLNGTVGGAGSISQIGTGNLVLNGNNSFINLGINQGTVTVGSNTAAGAGSIALNDGATLAAGADGIVLANDIETTGGGLIDAGTGVFTLNGTIGGAGSISQVGVGNLVLNGNNSFTNLGINQGTVTVGTNTAAGIGDIAINNNATLAAGVSGLVLANGIQTTANGIINSGPGVFTLNGVISGAGSISQVGTGNLVLNGDNSFTNLGINQGTVTVGTNTAAGIGAIAINNDATLAAGVSGLVLTNGIVTTANGIVDSGPGVFTLNGNISGAGSISQVGTGNLVLNGNNSFVNLGINQGTVTVGANTAAGAGAIAINDNATLAAGVSGLVLANAITTTGTGIVDSGPGVFTLNGNINGAGSISQVGTGNLVLNGANSFRNLGINQGTVTVGTNTAAGVGEIAINNNATLVAGVSGLTLSNDIQTTGNGTINSGAGMLTLSGVIGNTGSITKAGSGVLTLSGMSTYTGPTLVTAGRLNVTGSIGRSATTLQTGTTLSGTGTVGALTAQSGSTVSPGATTGAIGTLSVNGALTLAAGSTYIVDVGTGGADRISASGPASIAGNVVINPVGSPFVFGDTIILSSSARTGTFANSTVNGVFGPAITSTLTYTSTSVLLSLVPRSLVSVGGSALTGNAFQVAAAVDRSVAAGYNPSAFFALYTQGANLPTALSQLSGELHSAERRVQLEDSRVVRETAFDRLNAGLSAISGATAVTTDKGDMQTTVWLRGAGSWGTAKGDDFGSRFETEQKGILAGVDVAMDEFKVGAMFTYTETDIDFNSPLGQSTVKSTGGAIYGGYRQAGGGFAIGLGGSYASNSAEGTRAITATGLAQSLASNVDGRTFQIFGEAAYDLIGDAATRVEPFARLAHTQVRTNRFTETGGTAALTGFGSRYDLTVLDVGLRGGVVLSGFELIGSAAWHRTTGDRSALTYSSFTGPNGQAGIRASALDRHAVALEAQAKFNITPMLSLGAGYSGIIGDKNTDHGGRATLTFGF